MCDEKVNELAKRLVAICKQEHPEMDNQNLQDDAKTAVKQIYKGGDFIAHILKRDDSLVLLFAKFLLRNGLLNSKHTVL